MKTAISIPDSVFLAAEEVAARLELSRSALYTRAVAEFIARRSSDQVTEELDRVYAVETARPEAGLTTPVSGVSRADLW